MLKQLKHIILLKVKKNAIDQDINAKKVILEKLAEDYTRNKTAKTAGLITDEQLKASKAAYEQAEAGLKASQSNLEGTKVQLSGSLEEYPPLKQAIAMYKTAYINLSRTKIYAPVSGKVARKNITIGQKLIPNQAILVIVDLNNMKVKLLVFLLDLVVLCLYYQLKMLQGIG